MMKICATPQDAVRRSDHKTLARLLAAKPSLIVDKYEENEPEPSESMRASAESEPESSDSSRASSAEIESDDPESMVSIGSEDSYYSWEGWGPEDFVSTTGCCCC